MVKLRVPRLFDSNDLKMLPELEQFTLSPTQTDASHHHTSLGTLGSVFRNSTAQTSSQDKDYA